ncbi:N-acetylneuraminate synthase [Candidatus Parcubacteria bacterium]|nr:N-acetylneuraminate synthase [Candidatus Parcubacteria bacterium]
MKKIRIRNKSIGEESPCFIIAEAGVNHNGDLGLAKKLIIAAKQAGADAIKFQTFKAEDLVSKSAKMADYQKKNIGRKESQLEMLKKLELSNSNFRELKKYCDEKNIIFLSTAHTEDAVDFLNPLIPAYKVGSGDLTNLPFLEKIARKKKPIILSTGMAVLNEIKEALEAIKKTGNSKIILLHCTTNYPCPLEEANLRAIQTMEKEFNLPVGYSDHTSGIMVSVTAVATGAVVIEKHFTLDRNLSGPDHKASLEPDDLKKMVKEIRDVEKVLGSAIKKPSKSEEKIKKVARKSIVAKTDILKNTKITKEMLIIKRPGTGILPKHFNKVINRIVKKNIKQDALIEFKDLK